MTWNVVLFKGVKTNTTEETEEEEDRFLSNLKSLNELNVQIIPVLEFQFQSLDIIYSQLQQFQDYEGLILTSPRCVESIQRAILSSNESRIEWEEQLKHNWRCKRIYCVGPSTETSIQDIFQQGNSSCRTSPVKTIVSQIGTSEDLSQIIVQDFSKEPFKFPLLYPCGNLKTDTLSKILTKNNIQFNSITTYSTVQHSNLSLALNSLNSEEESKEITRTIYVFFSPSGIKFTLPNINQLEKKIFITIGPTTRSALERETPQINPSQIYQCSSPTPEALNDIIRSIISPSIPNPSP